MDTKQKNNMKMLSRLFEAGYSTEEKIAALSLDEMLEIPNITTADLKIITGLQKAIKDKKVVSFLSGDEKGESKKTSVTF